MWRECWVEASWAEAIFDSHVPGKKTIHVKPYKSMYYSRAGNGLYPTWKREKIRERRKPASSETPTDGGRNALRFSACPLPLLHVLAKQRRPLKNPEARHPPARELG